MTSSSFKYKEKSSSDKEMTDTEFYKDKQGGDPHKSIVLKSITS